MQKNSAILLMAGEGQRLGSNLPKQYHFLGDKRVYLHTLEKLLACALFEEILLVVASPFLQEVQIETNGLINIRLVEGGATRQLSSFLGVQACKHDTDYVLVHDAVRPFVSERILRENMHQVVEYRAVDTCIAMTDTVVMTRGGDRIDQTPPRHHCFRGQTPQTFAYPLILEAHKRAHAEGVFATDDCALVHRLNHPVKIVQGEENNIKITSQLDLLFAQQLLRLTHSHPTFANNTGL